MEGLLDYALRDVLTRAGGVDRCVSEFIRITDMLLPQRVFHRVMPELAHGGRTPAGVLVRGQLLGSDPTCMAENAASLAELGPAGVDLNFGCPAKVVNRHGGGASLLDDPELLHRIAAAVRRAVPAEQAVSAKMRLGTQDDGLAVACAQALAAGGVGELVVHARTKAHGYRPPAYWERVADIREAVAVPVVANGEIWSLADALRCREVSGCDALMLGRGMVADPGLALDILAYDTGRNQAGRGLSAETLGALLRVFWLRVQERVVPKYRAGRVKQWLHYLRKRYPLAELAYAELRTENDAQHLMARLCEIFPAVQAEGMATTV
ncbi:MAG: tRNA-dihydrouridine synthase [Vitreoscilla sp.]|nr:tRNA-dihydrouridine synthase [Vitreoscilla sp.]MBP6675578.1 tRNA-dihydrouridine synthase [Vitreoscilla sp.]